MFDSTNKNPDETVQQIREELLKAPPKDLPETQICAKLMKINKPWQRALLTVVIDFLLVVNLFFQRPK